MRRLFSPLLSALLPSLLLSLVATGVRADYFNDFFIDPEDGMLDMSRQLSEVPLGFLPVPAIITEPALGTGLGLAGIFFHESEAQKSERVSLGKQAGKAILPENISFIGALGTDNGSKGAAFGHLGFWKADSVRYLGAVLYPDFNLEFYSLDSLTLPRPLELNLSGPAVLQELKFRAGDSAFFLGLRQMYSTIETRATAGALLPPEYSEPIRDYLSEVLGLSSTQSGLGLVAEYDSRDNPMGPERGYKYGLKLMQFDEHIGSDIDYRSYQLKGLNYWALDERFQLGLRMVFDGLGEVDAAFQPPYIAPYIDLRGIPAMRYQGQHVAVAETELNWKLDARWKFSVFTGAGTTADHFDELGDNDTVHSYGAGFRYLMAKRYRMYMGIDVARGPEETAWYIQAGSRW